MKKVFLSFLLSCFILSAFAQTNSYTRADTIHLTNTAKNTTVLIDGKLRVLRATAGSGTDSVYSKGSDGFVHLIKVSAGGSFINNSTSLQTSANFRIDGTGRAQKFNADTAILLGVTSIPAWGASYRTINGPGGTALRFETGGHDVALSNNAYSIGNSITDWRYFSSGVGASTYYMDNSGGHNWYVAPSGTAGDTIHWLNPFSIDNGGNSTFSVKSGSDSTRMSISAGGIAVIGGKNSEFFMESFDSITENIASGFDVARESAQLSSSALNTLVNVSFASLVAGMDDGSRKAPYVNALVTDSLGRISGFSINQDTTQDVVVRGLHHIGLTGNELFTVSGDPNQYVQFGNLTVGSGTVTSITPGVGFLSHTPITTSGTMDIDTASTIVTKTFAGRYSTTVTFHPSALGDITSGSVSGPTLQPNLTIISSVGLSGNPTSTTQTTGENTNRIATDAFVNASISAITPISAANPTASAGTTPVNGSATTFMRSDAAPKVDSAAFTTRALLTTYLTKSQVVATYAPLASPALTGTPTAPTATVGTNTTQVATTAFVLANAGGTTFANPTASVGVTPVNGSATTAMRSDAAPKADTTALRTVANSRTLAQEQTALNLKAPIASPTFTGVVTIPTPFTLGATSVTSTGTQLNYLNAATGTTGTTSTNVVFSTSPTITTPVFTTNITTPLILGGTTTSSNLIMQSTTANGLAANGVKINVGNNGATTAFFAANDGTIAMGGAATGSYGLNITGPANGGLFITSYSGGAASSQIRITDAQTETAFLGTSTSGAYLGSTGNGVSMGTVSAGNTFLSTSKASISVLANSITMSGTGTATANALTISSTNNVTFGTTVQLHGYTVSTLPTGSVGMTAYVTDALTPSFGTTLVGGGAIVTKAFYNGTNWIAE